MTSTHPDPAASSLGFEVEASLMLVAARGDDLTDAVYARLFARAPAMEAEFWRDRSGAIRGEMLARVFEAILDLCGPGSWAPDYIASEAVVHDSYGVPRDIFPLFFAAIGDAVAAALGAEFTPAMAAGWRWLEGVARAAMTLPECDTAARIAATLAVLPDRSGQMVFPQR